MEIQGRRLDCMIWRCRVEVGLYDMEIQGRRLDCMIWRCRVGGWTV